MKRNSYFLTLLALMLTLSLQAKQTTVKNATELIAVFAAAQDADTIKMAPGFYNVSNKLVFPKTGIITLTSLYPQIKDSIPTLAMNMVGQVIPVGVKAGLIFEYLKIQHNNPTATSGHIIYINKFFGNIAKLVFRHCEISNGVRGLFRSVKPDNTADVTYTSCGDLDYLEMTNCLVHSTFVTSGNAWPLLYLGHLPLEVKIENNTFYNMPYMKHIFTMNYADPNSGRNVKFDFKNNTVCTTVTNNYIATGNFLGEETEFNIENNVFLMPNWVNALNVENSPIPAIISCRGGIITTKNNVVEGPKPWIKGQTVDLEGQGGFVVIDTTNTYKMADLDFGWSDFADPENADYSNLSSKKLAFSGVGGTPIGDPRWVRNYTNPKTLSVSFTPETIKPTILPRRAFYENGSSVTVKASAVDGYIFKGWKNAADNSTVSTENPYTFNIGADINLVAEYAILQQRNVAITINGSKSASYTITPTKTTYFEGDAITIALNKHYVNDFNGWSDGSTEMSRSLTISSDVNLTANFTEHPYILAWDFHQLTANNQSFTNLAANHAKDEANPGIMNYVTLDTIRTISTRNNKFTGVGQEQINCVARRTIRANFANPDYLFFKFSTKGLINMRVQCDYGTDNSMMKVQKMQYSLNGKDYTDFKSDTISGNIDMVWLKLQGILPVAAENQDSVWVRFIADPTSDRLFVTGVTDSEYDYAYISKIIVMDANFSAINPLNFKDSFRIYSYNDKLVIRSENTATAQVYSLMGQKVSNLQINTGYNEFSNFSSGIYIVRIGSEVQKVLIK